MSARRVQKKKMHLKRKVIGTIFKYDFELSKYKILPENGVNYDFNPINENIETTEVSNRIFKLFVEKCIVSVEKQTARAR
jgi:hypothetical protein